MRVKSSPQAKPADVLGHHSSGVFAPRVTEEVQWAQGADVGDTSSTSGEAMTKAVWMRRKQRKIEVNAASKPWLCVNAQIKQRQWSSKIYINYPWILQSDFLRPLNDQHYKKCCWKTCCTQSTTLHPPSKW